MKINPAVLLLCAACFVCTSCMSIGSPYQKTSIQGKVIEKDYEILGTVSIESTTRNVLGLFSWGGSGYKDMLEKAQAEYGADAVINIYEDVKLRTVFLVYNSFTRVVTGTAIRYK